MDFSPLFQPLLGALWYLIPLFVLAAVIKSPWFKGKVGEAIVNLSTRLLLDKNRYHLIKNVTLPTEDGTTQIDHIIVSRYGVFVVETKNMKGWIFGNAKQRYWTQKIFKHAQRFQNPLHQNYKHVKTVQALLGLSDHQVHSVVVFVGESTFKTAMPDNVTQGIGYVRYIRSKKDLVLSPEQVSEVLDAIASGRLKASLSTDRAHNRHVRALVAERHGISPGHSGGGWLLKILVYPILVFGIVAVVMNAYSNFVSKATEIATQRTSEPQVENRETQTTQPEPVVTKPEIKPEPSAETVVAETTPEQSVQRVHQPPSELFLAKQECNSLIAAAIGNTDQRLLKERNKACARYRSLQQRSD